MISIQRVGAYNEVILIIGALYTGFLLVSTVVGFISFLPGGECILPECSVWASDLAISPLRKNQKINLYINIYFHGFDRRDLKTKPGIFQAGVNTEFYT